MNGAAPSALLTGAASAFPPSRSQADMWSGYFASRLDDDRWARRVFMSAGASQRHPAVDPTAEDISGWSTGARMERYLAEALPLGKSAVGTALARAGLDAADLGLFAVVSCTGYATPGIDIHLARDLGMDPGTQRLLIGHMGCYAALPGLGAVRDYVIARGRPAALLCIELSSLHVQPTTRDLQQLVTHALFSDAASAVVVQPGGAEVTSAPAPLQIVDVAAVTDAATADHMTWDITDLGFRMGLSRRVPDVLARHVAPLVDQLLDANGLARQDVAAWAVHPGGPRILDVVGDRLGLQPAALDVSRRVLDQHGNCSSATVLLVLEALRPGLQPGDPVVAIAFGPGLTLYASLLRA
jgi:alkylresorcinol/alkylpyrone synthase